MASSAKDIQLRELKDTITELKTMISEQTELIRSLRLVIDEKTSHEKALQEQVDYLTKKLFGSSSERRTDDIPGQQNLFDEAEVEQDLSLLEEETVIREHSCKGSHPSSGKRSGLPGLRYADGANRRRVCPPWAGIHPGHMQSDRILQPELWMSVLQGRTGRHGKTCDCKVPGSTGSGRKRTGDRIHRCMDDVSEVRQWTSPVPSGERLETVWCPDQQDDTCQLDHLLFQELLSANV